MALVTIDYESVHEDIRKSDIKRILKAGSTERAIVDVADRVISNAVMSIDSGIDASDIDVDTDDIDRGIQEQVYAYRLAQEFKSGDRSYVCTPTAEKLVWDMFNESHMNAFLGRKPGEPSPAPEVAQSLMKKGGMDITEHTLHDATNAVINHVLKMLSIALLDKD